MIKTLQRSTDASHGCLRRWARLTERKRKLQRGESVHCYLGLFRALELWGNRVDESGMQKCRGESHLWNSLWNGLHQNRIFLGLFICLFLHCRESNGILKCVFGLDIKMLVKPPVSHIRVFKSWLWVLVLASYKSRDLVSAAMMVHVVGFLLLTPGTWTEFMALDYDLPQP